MVLWEVRVRPLIRALGGWFRVFRSRYHRLSVFYTRLPARTLGALDTRQQQQNKLCVVLKQVDAAEACFADDSTDPGQTQDSQSTVQRIIPSISSTR